MKNVTIYTTNTCHFCGLAKDFFKKHNITYTEHNVGTDLERRKEMISISGQMGVPVITVDKNLVIGFDEPALTSLLDIKA